MPFPRPTFPFPSFRFVLSSRRDPTDLPDYYRTTRHEHYGPHCRSSAPLSEPMKVIDIRREESYEYSCSFLLSFDDEHGIEFHHEEDLEAAEVAFNVKEVGGINGTDRRFLTFLRDVLTTFVHKCTYRRRKIHTVTHSPPGYNFDLCN